MPALALDQAARLSGLGKIAITRAIKSCWHSASRKADGSCEIDPVEPEPSARRLHALIPWRPAQRPDLRADEELRHQLALAEERLAESQGRDRTFSACPWHHKYDRLCLRPRVPSERH
jgi:hypothetical protein